MSIKSRDTTGQKKMGSVSFMMIRDGLVVKHAR